MICRYRGAAYAPGDHGCENCGAPKGAVVQSLLDRAAASDAWAPSYRRGVRATAIVTGAFVVADVLFLGYGTDEDMPLILFNVAWLLLGVPIVLGVTSIVAARGRAAGFLLNAALSVLVWIAVLVVLFLSINVSLNVLSEW